MTKVMTQVRLLLMHNLTGSKVLRQAVQMLRVNAGKSYGLILIPKAFFHTAQYQTKLSF